jgi:hypothetical protein
LRFSCAAVIRVMEPQQKALEVKAKTGGQISYN